MTNTYRLGNIQKSFEFVSSDNPGAIISLRERVLHMRHTCIGHLLTAMSLALSAPASAYEQDPEQPLFSSHDVLNITLEAPFKTLIRESDKPEDFAAKLSYAEHSGQEYDFDIKLRARGDFRRDKDHCRLPPLRVNFKKKQVKGSLFENQNKLKPVTHCNPKSSIYDQYVLKESLVYRTLNLLTDTSFRIRLLRVNYVDTEGKWRLGEHYGFFIEHKDHLARRNHASVPDIRQIRPAQLEPGRSNIMEVFQYLIGNTDWSFLGGPGDEVCCHNAILLSDTKGQFIPVPYDFDITGMVDPPYAVIDRRFRLASVRKRLYRGFCGPTRMIDKTIALYLDRKDAIYRMYRDYPALNNRSRAHSIEYLDSFYKTADDPKRVRKKLVGKCR